jgi:hypothetical protein
MAVDQLKASVSAGGSCTLVVLAGESDTGNWLVLVEPGHSRPRTSPE